MNGLAFDYSMTTWSEYEHASPYHVHQFCLSSGQPLGTDETRVS